MARIMLRYRPDDAYLGPLDGHEIVHEPDDRVQVLLTSGVQGATAADMQAMPALSLIICVGSGFEGVDLAAAKARGIRVANGGAANAECVADMAFGLLLATGRRIGEGDRYIRAGQWGRAPRPGIVPAVHGARLGILGLGAIGAAVARRGEGFGMHIAYCNRSRCDVPFEFVATPLALAERSDFLVLALRAGPENRHLVNESVLRALGPQGALVNVSRGSVIDEDALVRALNEGWIRGAGLDVYGSEPDIRPDLIAAPNTVLSPHLGGFTTWSLEQAVVLAAKNITAHLAGQPLLTPVL